MRRAVLLASASLLVAFTRRVAGPPKTETVSLRSGDETTAGYLALPGSAGRHPAIIVIHEWWGLNDWVKGQAEKFREQGKVSWPWRRTFIWGKSPPIPQKPTSCCKEYRRSARFVI